jgi:hypothetical protein
VEISATAERETPMTPHSSKRAPPPGKNRLVFEKSPYLLQHADNPVDWYPWGDEAFAKAKREDKPIFLSIGYSTCHWCHVMEHESFEDPAVAALMNNAFINIKVDREERPDIDTVYMSVCQMVRGNGGWPLTVIMTPDAKPFFVATYLPKTGRYGLAGMVEFIPQIEAIWRNRRDEVHTTATQITEQLQKVFSRDAAETGPGEETLTSAYEDLAARFDAVNGGFSGAPKFPTPHNLLFLLRYWRRSGERHALEMVERTLAHMARGGIYDHIGFGFHRYSTDERWFAPHFEKMMYDQALLVMAYTECFLATGNDEYKITAEEILAYVLRDMTDAAGGFYSAEDADSEGEEGKFYLWRERELIDLLGEDDGRLIVDLFGVEMSGNFAGEIEGANILHLRRPIERAAESIGVPESELRSRMERLRRTLYAAREKRIHPHKDDKILTDWNGLMIAGLAKAARAFDEPRYAEAAERAVRFILGNMRTGEGRLVHRYRDGEAAVAANLDDYGFLVWGLVELYETTFEAALLKTAIELTDDMNRRFWDTGGGFYFAPDDGESMIVRTKGAYDGAVPSGNSVAAVNLTRLGRLTGDPRFEEQAEKIGRVFFDEVRRAPSAFTFFMTAVELGVGPSREVVIVGDPRSADTRAMKRAIHSVYAPETVLLFKSSLEKDPDISRVARFTASHTALGGAATAFVCENYACGMPTTDVGEMLAALRIRAR